MDTDRPTTTLGTIGTKYGWKYGEVVAKLENERKELIFGRFLFVTSPNNGTAKPLLVKQLQDETNNLSFN
jgi:hypothetical protein